MSRSANGTRRTSGTRPGGCGVPGRGRGGGTEGRGLAGEPTGRDGGGAADGPGRTPGAAMEELLRRLDVPSRQLREVPDWREPTAWAERAGCAQASLAAGHGPGAGARAGRRQ